MRPMEVDAMSTFFGHVSFDGDTKAWPEGAGSECCALEGYVLPVGSQETLSGASGSDACMRIIESEGLSGLATLDGEFAVAFRDSDSSLVLARDVLGSRPMYYAKTSAGVAFGTSIATIIDKAELPCEPHLDVVRQYLLGEDRRGVETFFAGISRVLPGEVVRISRGEVERTVLTKEKDQFFSVPSNPRRADHTCVEEFRTRLGDAVARRAGESGALLLTTVDPVAAAALDGAARASHAPLDSLSLSASTGGPELDSGHEGEVRATPQGLKNDLPRMLRVFEEPPTSLTSYFMWLHLHACRQEGRSLAIDSYGARALRAPEKAHRSVLSRAFAAARRREKAVPASLLGTALRRDHAGQRVAPEPLPEYAGPLAPLGYAGSVEAEQRAKAAQAFGSGVAVCSPFTDRAFLRFYASLDDTAFGAGARPSLIEAAADVSHGEGTTLTDGERDTAWFKRIKGTYFALFSSQSFGTRGWFNQAEILKAYDAHINGRPSLSAGQLWRFACAELWARLFFDADDLREQHEWEDSALLADDNGQSLPPDPHTPLTANAGKQLDLALDGDVVARRYPIQTEKFSKESRMDEEIAGYVKGFFQELDERGTDDDRHATEGRRWNFTVSEKIIAIMQGRSWFVWEIKPSFAAKQLSKFVTRTPAGIGLGDPVTMQLAINEAGLARITYAAALGALGKLRGKRGVFYELAGADVRAIDGPTEYSVYPSNVSAKLPPKDPDQVAEHLVRVIRDVVPARFAETFDGVVVMDANDIGRNVLGLSATQERAHYEAQFADNPLGQGSQQTPMAVVFERPARER